MTTTSPDTNLFGCDSQDYDSLADEIDATVELYEPRPVSLAVSRLLIDPADPNFRGTSCELVVQGWRHEWVVKTR